MPIYEFKDKKTGEVIEISMPISQYDEYIKNNPDVERYYSSAPSIRYAGGTTMLQRAGDGWKDVQNKIKKGLPPRLRDNIKTK